LRTARKSLTGAGSRREGGNGGFGAPHDTVQLTSIVIPISPTIARRMKT